MLIGELANIYDFALVAMPGLLGLRILEAVGADISDLGEEHGHRALRVHGKGSKVVSIPLPPAIGRVSGRAGAGRSGSTAMVPGWTAARPTRHRLARAGVVLLYRGWPPAGRPPQPRHDLCPTRMVKRLATPAEARV